MNNLLNSKWREAQFAYESRVSPTADVMVQMQFTPSIPLDRKRAGFISLLVSRRVCSRKRRYAVALTKIVLIVRAIDGVIEASRFDHRAVVVATC